MVIYNPKEEKQSYSFKVGNKSLSVVLKAKSINTLVL